MLLINEDTDREVYWFKIGYAAVTMTACLASLLAKLMNQYQTIQATTLCNLTARTFGATIGLL